MPLCASCAVTRRWAQAVALACVMALGAGCASKSAPAEVRETRNTPIENPGDPQRLAEVRLELAGLYFGRGQLTTALGEVGQALEAKPDLAEAHGLRALILASMGDTVAADQAFKRAIQLAPTTGGAMHNYAWFLCQQDRFAESEKQFGAALALPRYRDGVRTLMAQGVCQVRAGRLEEAERTLMRSFELDPANPVTAFHLSQLLLQRGALERARFMIRRVNSVPQQVSAQSLWLAARIEKRLGNTETLKEIGHDLRSKYAQSPETEKFESGKFDD